jgi:hypothetical protein
MRTFYPLVDTAEKFETVFVCPIRRRDPEPERKPLEKVQPQKITVTALNGAKISRCQHGSYWVENEKHSGPSIFANDWSSLPTPMASRKGSRRKLNARLRKLK